MQNFSGTQTNLLVVTDFKYSNGYGIRVYEQDGKKSAVLIHYGKRSTYRVFNKEYTQWNNFQPDDIQKIDAFVSTLDPQDWD